MKLYPLVCCGVEFTRVAGGIRAVCPRCGREHRGGLIDETEIGATSEAAQPQVLPCAVPALSRRCPECGSSAVDWIYWDAATRERRYKCLACKHEWGVRG